MKPYWDSSALIESTYDPALNSRLADHGGFTRVHALSEVFSTLTGKVSIAMSANDAAKIIKAMLSHLELVELSSDEIVEALTKAQSLGVRGARIYDYVHALAAKKSGTKCLVTMDRNDFNGLVPGLTIEQV